MSQEKELLKLFGRILRQILLQNRETDHINAKLEDIMGQMEDLQAAIADIQAKVDADVAQDQQVITAINDLLGRIQPTPDLQPFIDALKAAGDKLASDNDAVQAAINAAVPPANP